MTTFTETESLQYGFSIIPLDYCKVQNLQLNEELLLSPGIEYYIPWNIKATAVVTAEAPLVSGVCPAFQRSALDEESFNWLKIAEGAFKFWDNERDEVWNNV